MAHVGFSLFGAVLLYYWTYLYVRVLLLPPEESALTYAITALPVALAAGGAVLFRIGRGMWPVVTGRALALLAFIAAAIAASVTRGDLASVRSAGLMGLSLIWLGTTGGGLSVKALNGFFVASILVGGLWFILGLSEYGLLPGQYAEGADRGLTWRVSLFPFLPESAFMSLIVFLANQLYRRGVTRLVLCAASLYFLVFSGIRSAVFALILCEVYIFLNSRRRSTRFRATHLLMLLTVFVLAIAATTLAAILPSLQEGVLGNYLFRTDSVADSEAGIDKTIYRVWLWSQHLNLFLSSPLTGVGTFNFSSVVTSVTIAGTEDTGSEAFITAWLARLGLCFLPFIVYLVILGRRAAASPHLFQGAVFLVLGVACLVYGSFLVPYNFMFLVLFRLLLQVRASRAMPVRETTPSLVHGRA